MPAPRPPRRGITLTSVARYLGRRTSYVRWLAMKARVKLLPVKLARCGGNDRRPRQGYRRDYRLLARRQVMAILRWHYALAGAWYLRGLAGDKQGWALEKRVATLLGR